MPAVLTYLGPAGSFAEQALRTVPGADTAELTPATTVADVLRTVRDGSADAGLVPLESSVEGGVPTTLDDLASGTPLSILREVLLPVTFGLYAQPGIGLDEVRRVASHPHGLAQCRDWLRTHLPDAATVETTSTSEAAAAVARGDWDAAVCAPVAGEHHRLVELGKDIGDNRGAVTRFVLVGRPARPPARTGSDVTSLIVFIAHDRTGALLEVLTEFAVRGINLTRIESRPTKERLGRYCFFLDCSGHIEDVRVGDALMALHRICADVRFLGSYPRESAESPPSVPPGLSDQDFAEAAGWLARLRHGEP